MCENFPFVYSSFSPDFVSPLFPGKGEKLKLSIASSIPLERVILKYDSNIGVVMNEEMKEDGTFNGMVKYSGIVDANLDDTLFHYFFAFFVDDKSYYYSKSGLTRFTPSVGERFSLLTGTSSPEWVASSTCYQIFPDRFCNGDKSIGAEEGEYEFDGGKVTTPRWTADPEEWDKSRCCDFYNGDLRGIEEKVDYLKALSINTIYINPIFSSESVHRYDTTDFFSVDPKLGGDEALVHLVETMHKASIRVILDISINHTGLKNKWLEAAVNDPGSEERGFYFFNSGNTPLCWHDVKTLPQLNYTSQTLRDYMYRLKDSVMKKYISSPFNIDGWRLDVAPEVGRRGAIQLCREIWREIRRELKSVKKDLYIVGEDWDDSPDYLTGDMWDGVMNYYGVSRPLRSWLGERDRFFSPRDGSSPETEEPWTGVELASALKRALSSLPGEGPYMQMNLIDSHDTIRLHNNEKVFDRDLYKGVVLTQYILPGMPSLYYGDEVLLRGRTTSMEGARFPMEWRKEKMDGDMLSFYRELGSLRKGWSDYFYAATEISPLDDESVAIMRIRDKKALILMLNRGKDRVVSLSHGILPPGNVEVLFGEGAAEIDGKRLSAKLKEKKSLLISIAQ